MHGAHPVWAEVLMHADDMEVVVGQWCCESGDLQHTPIAETSGSGDYLGRMVWSSRK